MESYKCEFILTEINFPMELRLEMILHILTIVTGQCLKFLEDCVPKWTVRKINDRAKIDGPYKNVQTDWFILTLSSQY